MQTPELNGKLGGSQALLWLLFKHYDRISERLGSEGAGPWLHESVKWAQILVSHELDDDEAYKAELKQVQEDFKEENRPRDTHPKRWGFMKRLEEMEVITKHLLWSRAW